PLGAACGLLQGAALAGQRGGAPLDLALGALEAGHQRQRRLPAAPRLLVEQLGDGRLGGQLQRAAAALQRLEGGRHLGQRPELGGPAGRARRLGPRRRPRLALAPRREGRVGGRHAPVGRLGARHLRGEDRGAPAALELLLQRRHARRVAHEALAAPTQRGAVADEARGLLHLAELRLARRYLALERLGLLRQLRFGVTHLAHSARVDVGVVLGQARAQPRYALLGQAGALPGQALDLADAVEAQERDQQPAALRHVAAQELVERPLRQQHG